MRKILSRITPTPLKNLFREPLGSYSYARRAYSQEGEDLVLHRVFERQAHGIYVDVGAHHPFRFSNTCLLHQRGWRGINVDAMPGSMALFNRFRRGDVNLEVGVGLEKRTLEFHLFQEPALNTFDSGLANDRQKEGWARQRTIEVPCLPLYEILTENLHKLGASTIDLLTVDVEGFDIEVLESNDWNRFSPRALVVEILDKDIVELTQSKVYEYCAAKGYRAHAKLHHSVVFLRS
jgi:FkbM family methyltransferase